MKKGIWKYLVWVVGLIALLSSGVNAAESQAKQIVRVAFPQAPGFSETYPDGFRCGVVYEWLVEIAKYTGWEYEFVEEKNVNDMLRGMEDSRYDLIGGMLKLPEIASVNATWYYPKYLMGYSASVLIYRKDDAEIKNFDISTLDRKTIGVFSKAKSKIKRLQNILEFNRLNCALRYYDDPAVYENALKNGEVDLLLAGDAYVTDDYNIALRFPSEPAYIVARKDDPALCRQLDEAIEKIYAVNPNFGEALFQKYFPEKYKNSAQFTQSERQFIRESAPLKVAVVAEDNYPFYYFVDGATRGIVPEVFALLSKKTGLCFQYVEAACYNDAIEMVETGAADLFGNFINNDMTKASDSLLITKHYASLDSIVLRNKNANLLDENLTEAVMDEDDWTSSHIKRSKVAHFKSYADCLQAVDTGAADYTVVPMAVLEYLYIQDYYANLVPMVDSAELYLSVAMNRRADTDLYTVLTKAIVNTPDEQLRAAVSGNTLVGGVKQMSVKSLLYSNPVLSAVVIASFLGLLGVIFFMYLWFKLQNRIAYAKLEQEKELGKVRSDFLSRMSHEIRTPLNAIVGFINLMRFSKGGDADLQKNIAKIDSSAKFLLSLVNDILDMSKLENGKMQLEQKPFAMLRLMRQLEDIFSAMAEEKQLFLQFDCKLSQQNFVGDAFRLKQILTNLLSNAYKFTKRGGEIRVAVEEIGLENAVAQLRFSVLDNGIGIPPGDQERIFHSFEQVCGGDGISQRGTGLGLAISYNLARLMGSALQVESEVGRGSQFYFTVALPVYEGAIAAETEETFDAEHNLLRGKRILLAEDNELNAEIAVELLKLQGVAVDWALNGQEAVEKFAASAQGDYDMILMDLQMPLKNGLEAAREIRAMERADAAAIPILAMTANTLREDRESAFAAGMNGFIPKPFDVEQLYQSVELFFRAS